jgi:hypothetical protein
MNVAFDNLGTMAQLSYPSRLVLVALAGWINHTVTTAPLMARCTPRRAAEREGIAMEVRKRARALSRRLFIVSGRRVTVSLDNVPF